MRTFALLLGLLLPLAGGLASETTPSPEGARVYFVGLQDGAKVKSPVTVRFGLAGMGVAPAGIAFAETGHHHLLIDVDALPAPDQPIPADSKHVHFGKGQTEAQLELPPGEHSLQLLLGDHMHRPHDPPVVSERITIIVE
jgi:hypothetical protein